MKIVTERLGTEEKTTQLNYPATTIITETGNRINIHELKDGSVNVNVECSTFKKHMQLELR
jgi:hypothetical protein